MSIHPTGVWANLPAALRQQTIEEINAIFQEVIHVATQPHHATTPDTQGGNYIR